MYKTETHKHQFDYSISSENSKKAKYNFFPYGKVKKLHINSADSELNRKSLFKRFDKNSSYHFTRLKPIVNSHIPQKCLPGSNFYWLHRLVKKIDRDLFNRKESCIGNINSFERELIFYKKNTRT